MSKKMDPASIARIAIMVLLGFIVFYSIFSMIGYGKEQMSRQTSDIEQIIRRALVQCYALEGSYPTDIEYVKTYGVIFNRDLYIYHYDWFSSNMMPNVIVLKK